MADLEALVVAAYVFADEYPVPARCGRPPLVSDSERVALAVCQAAIGISSDRQFLGLAERVLPASKERLAADGITLLIPDKTRTAANAGRQRALASTRLVIESVFANLKGQMRLEGHLAKTPAGSPFASRSASSRSRSGSCSAPSQADPHAPSPPTTGAKSDQASSRGLDV